MFSCKIYHVDGNVAIKWKSKFIWGKALLGRRWTCKSEVIPSNSYRGLYPFYAWPLAMFVFVSSWFFAHLFLGLVSNSPLCLVLSALCLHFPFVCCFSLWTRARPISEDVINPGFVIFFWQIMRSAVCRCFLNGLATFNPLLKSIKAIWFQTSYLQFNHVMHVCRNCDTAFTVPWSQHRL